MNENSLFWNLNDFSKNNSKGEELITNQIENLTKCKQRFDLKHFYAIYENKNYKK